MEFSKIVKERYACKGFGDKKVSKEDLMAIIEAGRVAPTAKNIQPYHIYVIESDEYLAKVDEITPCRYGAPAVLAVTFIEDGAFCYPGTQISSATEDATIVATHLCLAATDLGINSCWVNAFNPDKAHEILGLKDNEKMLMFLDLGYKKEGAEPLENHFSRKSVDEVVSYL